MIRCRAIKYGSLILKSYELSEFISKHFQKAIFEFDRVTSVIILCPGIMLYTLEEHIGVVRCLCLLGNRLISGGDRKRIAIWDVTVSAFL